MILKYKKKKKFTFEGGKRGSYVKTETPALPYSIKQHVKSKECQQTSIISSLLSNSVYNFLPVFVS